MHLDLVPVWTIILAVGVFMYVLLDGFDLGIGLLFPMAQDDDTRTLMMSSVAPVWDGNETWLVLGRRRIACSVSARLRDHYSGAVFSVAVDAAGVDIPRRRVRVSFERHASPAMVGS